MNGLKIPDGRVNGLKAQSGTEGHMNGLKTPSGTEGHVNRF